MIAKTFFVCPNCGNAHKFKLFNTSFQVIKQSPKKGKRTDETGFLPSLRDKDNYIECQQCLREFAYDRGVDAGKNAVNNVRCLKTKRNNRNSMKIDRRIFYKKRTII
ncbi:MAG: hypothetical protein MRJ65_08815 [Candidatus Brocadiaceae bacterium]|nr:hypothetical protein [Candidatus Brocadiaceae bacterium]